MHSTSLPREYWTASQPAEEGFAGHQGRRAPLLGFVAATLISIGLWGMLAIAVWVAVH